MDVKVKWKQVILVNPTVDRCDINNLAKKMLSNESAIPMEQKRGIKKFLKEINKLDIANKADIVSYQLGYQDGVRDTKAGMEFIPNK